MNDEIDASETSRDEFDTKWRHAFRSEIAARKTTRDAAWLALEAAEAEWDAADIKLNITHSKLKVTYIERAPDNIKLKAAKAELKAAEAEWDAADIKLKAAKAKWKALGAEADEDNIKRKLMMPDKTEIAKWNAAYKELGAALKVEAIELKDANATYDAWRIVYAELGEFKAKWNAELKVARDATWEEAKLKWESARDSAHCELEAARLKWKTTRDVAFAEFKEADDVRKTARDVALKV